MKNTATLLLFCFLSFFAFAGFRPLNFSQPKDSLKTLQLFNVIRSGSSTELENLLKQDADANDTLSGYSALMVAAMSGTLDQMKILTAHGAEINFINGDSVSALFLAVPDRDKTLFLLDHGANLQQAAKDGTTILSKLAFIPGSVPLMKLLIERGADPQKSNTGNQLIFRSALSGDTANLSFFIQLGFNVNDTNEHGIYPLVLAAGFYCLPTIKMMVEHGAGVNNYNKKTQYTALMRAARAGDDETIVYLLEHGADANVVNNYGYTALTYLGLSETDRPDITETLCKELGAQAFVKARDGANGAFYLAKQGNTRSVEVLKKYMKQQQK